MSFRPFTAALAVCVVASLLPGQKISEDPNWIWAEFKKAVKEDNFARQQELLVNAEVFKMAFYNNECIWCELSAEAGETPNPIATETMQVLEAMATIYKLVPPKSDFLVKRVAWLRELTPEQKKIKAPLQAEQAKLWEVFERARRTRSEAVVREVIPQYAALAEACEKSTDYYWAAQASWCMGLLYDLIPDYFEAVWSVKRGAAFGSRGHSAAESAKQNIDATLKDIAGRGKIRIDLVDISLPVEEAKTKYKAALDAPPPAAPEGGGEKPAGNSGAGGAGKPASGAGEAGMPAGPKPNVHAGKLDWEDATEMKPSILTADPAYLVPDFRYNAHWIFWRGQTVKRDSDAAQFPALPGGAEIKNEGGKLFLIPPKEKDGGKPKPPIRLKVGAKPEVQVFDNVRYLDDSTGKIGHFIMQWPSDYQINGYRFNASTSEATTVLLKGATIVKGKARGMEFVLHDIDGNGSFNDFGVDCIVTGSAKNQKVQPLSRYVWFGDHFFELKLEANGKTLRTKPYDGPIAAVKLEYKGATKPSFLVMQGTGEESAYFFDAMAAADKPIWVIPGSVQFYEGYITVGRFDKAQSLTITRGRSGTQPIQAGTLNVLKFGGAGDKGFSFEFKPRIEKEAGQEVLKIAGNELKIVGAFGEVYERSLFGPPIPNVHVRKGKDGPVVMHEKMGRAETADINRSNVYMYLPKDFEAKKTFVGEGSVQLECDFKPLGKITSDWVPTTN